MTGFPEAQGYAVFPPYKNDTKPRLYDIYNVCRELISIGKYRANIKTTSNPDKKNERVLDLLLELADDMEAAERDQFDKIFDPRFDPTSPTIFGFHIIKRTLKKCVMCQRDIPAWAHWSPPWNVQTSKVQYCSTRCNLIHWSYRGANPRKAQRYWAEAD